MSIEPGIDRIHPDGRGALLAAAGQRGVPVYVLVDESSAAAGARCLGHVDALGNGARDVPQDLLVALAAVALEGRAQRPRQLEQKLPSRDGARGAAVVAADAAPVARRAVQTCVRTCIRYAVCGRSQLLQCVSLLLLRYCVSTRLLQTLRNYGREMIHRGCV